MGANNIRVHYTQISARIEGFIVSTEEIRVYYDIHGLNKTTLYYRVTNEDTKELEYIYEGETFSTESEVFERINIKEVNERTNLPICALYLHYQFKNKRICY